MRLQIQEMRKTLTAFALFVSSALPVMAQWGESINESENNLQQDQSRRTVMNRDSSHAEKEVPVGLEVWTVDERFGDRTPATADTLHAMFMNSIFTTGLRSEYNTLGNLGSPRQNRIFIDRPVTEQFLFTQPYDFVVTQIEQFHFTNTLSPITNLAFNTCGDKTNGEDHLKALFAVNAGKKLGFGFNFDYLYGRGYYQNQSTAHFNYTLYGSYLGDHYQAHVLLSTNHQKVAENGGIASDNYITHPELYNDNFRTNEIPTVLEKNWNRNDNQHAFLSHRYRLGFYRPLPDNPEEKKSKDKMKAKSNEVEETDSTEMEPKVEFVPVTSFIHTASLDNYRRIFQAYKVPANYYADTYNLVEKYGPDSIYDKMRHLRLKNTFAIALHEGFNRWAKAGLKAFVTSDLRHFSLPDTCSTDTVSHFRSFNEHTLSVGGQLSKTQGSLLHYNATLETWLVGEDAGQLYLDGSADLNFRLFGDTVQLAAKGFLHHQHPVFFYRHYQSRHLWWDNNDLDKETRLHAEGMFTFRKTNTILRVAFDDIKNYTYFGQSYKTSEETRYAHTVGVRQHSGNITLLTAQLDQRLHFGPLNWESVVTLQQSSNKDVLPVPLLNIYTNLFLKFKIAHVLDVDFGADARYFTKYYANDYCPALGQYTVQESDNKVELGNYPLVNVYANMNLMHTRFFVMYSHVNAGMGKKNYFFTPHYPLNGSVLRFGLSWNFFN